VIALPWRAAMLLLETLCIGQVDQLMDRGTRERLVDFYRPHNDELHDLVGERLDWLRDTESGAP
jgi:hypothetical protein